MSARRIARPFYEQPTRPVDVVSGLGIRNAWNFSLGNPAWSRCVVTGNIATYSADTVITAEGLFAPTYTYRFLGGLATKLPIQLHGAAPITILIGYRRTAGAVSWALMNPLWDGFYGQSGDCLSTNNTDFSGSVTPTAGARRGPVDWYAITMSGANDLRAAANGGAVATDSACAAPTPTSPNSTFYIGADSSDGNWADVYTSHVIVLDRAASNAELVEWSRNPWQLFTAKTSRIYFLPSAGGGGATGTLAATESGSDTASIAGDVLVQGALAGTESGSDTAALTGDVLVQGALAVTETGNDTAAATGLVLVQGALAATESGADTAAFTGDASSAVVGSIGATETGSDTAAVTGLVLIQGGLTATESGSDTASVTGLVLIQGGLSATESGSDTALISGTSAIIGTGTLAAVEGGTDTAAIGGVVRISGAIAAAESSSDTASLAGVVPISGMLEATEAGSDTADISSFRPTVPGIEYTLPQGKAHYTLPDGRAHFTIAA